MNIVFAGVGGQGSVLATAILGAAARRAGKNAVTSEVHGMAQRGGTVVTVVRYGEDVLAPVISEGEADILVAFERLEAIRQFPLVKRGGIALVNDHRISPMLDSMQLTDYPADLQDAARELGIVLQTFPASMLASQLGDLRLSGMVMLGWLANWLELPLDAWRGAIAETVPASTVQANLAAFATGEEWGVGPPSAVF